MTVADTALPRSRIERWRTAGQLVRSLVRVHPKPFIIAVSAAGVFALCTVASSVVLRWIIDHVIDPRFRAGHVATSTVLVGLGFIVGTGMVRAVAVVVRRGMAGVTRWRIAETLSGDIIDRLVAQPVSWHQLRASGELAARAGVDVDAAVDVISPLPYASSVVLLIAVSAVWLVYIDVPGGCKLGLVEVTIAGAVRAPLYLHGTTTLDEWKSTIRGYPGPWAEVASRNVIITVPSENVRTLDDPADLMTFWDSVMTACADLAARERRRDSPER
jgi:ABC-type multidrug transport system fused ATPase/permease subunit